MIKPKKNEIRKPVKSISGVTPIAVMLPTRKCNHGACVYCPSLNVPQSYTPKSPAVMRAMMFKYDAFEQVKARIKSFKIMNHPTDKIELIIMGGTFLQYPEKFQNEFVKKCYDALNSASPRDDSSKDDTAVPSGEPKSKNLEEAKKKNEKAKNRCIALCIETRPDVCSEKDIEKMRKWGATRVELGVQIIDDKIYEKIKRGHKIKDVIDATRRLKNAGFKVGYHIMPGLPGSNPQKDLKLFKKIFSNENFKPDQLKLYPCQVIPGSELENWYWKKKYQPYSKEQIEKLLIEMLKSVPRYCRVMRVMREIPPDYIVAGTIRIDLRKDIEKELRAGNIKLNEIRYREVGFNKPSNFDLELKITKYKASKGEEYFLEIVNKEDILFGLLRLRIFETPQAYTKEVREPLRGPDKFSKKISTRGKAIIRELHIYGQALKLGASGDVQHRGFGKELIEEAEKIVKENKIKKLKIISGVGVREYYKRLGYELENNYMVKSFK